MVERRRIKKPNKRAVTSSEKPLSIQIRDALRLADRTGVVRMFVFGPVCEVHAGPTGRFITLNNVARRILKGAQLLPWKDASNG